MFELSVPWWEFVVRGLAIYLFLIVMLRMTGKRQVGQLAPIDLILLLILSNAVQNSMNAGDNSLIGGMISATTLIVVNWIVGAAGYRWPRFEALIDGTPLVMVRDGRVNQSVLDDERITMAELQAALRLSGGFEMRDVKLAMLEPNGHVSVWTQASERASS
jgi:uncharacterized membrane protein YcaP (DUF421 family)